MTKYIDEAIIEVTSGDGGNGLIAWRKEKYEPMGGPAGGDGGRGGDIVFQANEHIKSLYDFTYKANFVAQAGKRGGPKKKHGASADNLVIPVPLGTVITNVENGEIIADLIYPNQSITVATGGLGGLGNASLATMRNKAPHYCEPGKPGVTLKLKLELKTLADIGLIGMPNAGKSSLLAKLSNAKPKIANYPFSTLTPNLGVSKDDHKIVFADIPGLIKGASVGQGLGLKFLRHIERTKCIIWVVDVSCANFLDDILDLNNELLNYSQNFREKKYLMVLNKIDLLDESVSIENLIKDINRHINAKKILKPQAILAISALNNTGIDKLLKKVEEILDQSNLDITSPIPQYNEYKQPERKRIQDPVYDIYLHRDKCHIEGDFITRYLNVTNIKDPESVQHFAQILRRHGVMDKIEKLNLNPGDTIIINNIMFKYLEDLY